MLTKLSKLVVAVSILTLIPMSSSHAECTEQDYSQIVFCLNADSLPTCLAQHPGCTADDVDTQVAAQELGDRVFGNCCRKGSKGARLGCLNAVKNSLRIPAVKNLVPSAVLTELSGNIADVITAVKAAGSCSNG